MVEQSLQINFGLAESLMNPYWLRMELVEPEDGLMTVSEAADFIDALYNTSICGQVNNPIEGKPEGSDWDRAFRGIALSTCDNLTSLNNGDPGAYDVQLKVFRSHQMELYKMVLSNGTAGSPRRTEERVLLTLDIENQSHIVLDTPIVDRPVISWTDIDGPDIHILGNTLYWGGVITGTLRAEFGTVYDLIDIHVNGTKNSDPVIITGSEDDKWLGTGWYSGDEDDSELTDVLDTECTALAFYHYQYEEIVLHKPENNESVTESELAAVCTYAGSTNVNGPGFGSTDTDVGDDGENQCFQSVRNTIICICGGDKSVTTEYVPAPCPSGLPPGGTVPGGSVEGSDEYIDCGSDNTADEDFYESKCCEPWPFGDGALPKCIRHYSRYAGNKASEEEYQDLLDEYGEDANIISVGPSGGSCGELVIEQKMPSVECQEPGYCDDKPILVWNYEESGDIVGQSSQLLVVVDGGVSPFEVSARGNGFYLDKELTISDALLDSASFYVYTDENACGPCNISVIDACSSVGEKVRCVVGAWIDRGTVSCEEAGLGIVDADDEAGGYTMTATAIIGAFKYSQGWSMQGPSPTPEYCYEPDISGCGTTIVPLPQRGRCQSTYGGEQSEPSWFAINENNGTVGNNVSCGWGSYLGRCETIGVKEWVCP